MEATAIQTNTANVQGATISLALIQPNNYNPRKNFDEQSLTELADSISRQGILHAIGVRPIAGTDRYEIVYGERRYRASLIAGKEDIKATVYTDLSDDEAEEKAIAENLHRQDITSMEEAEYNEIYEKRHQRLEERKALLAKDTEPEATEPEAENAPQEEIMPEAEPITEEATPDTSEVETEAIQYEPTEEEAEAILTEEERYCEEAVA